MKYVELEDSTHRTCKTTKIAGMARKINNK